MLFDLVQRKGVEPIPRFRRLDPKSSASANFAISAIFIIISFFTEIIIHYEEKRASSFFLFRDDKSNETESKVFCIFFCNL